MLVKRSKQDRNAADYRPNVEIQLRDTTSYSASEQATLVELAEMSDTDEISTLRNLSVSKDHVSARRSDGLTVIFSLYYLYWDEAVSGCAGQIGNDIRCRTHCR